MRILEKQFDEIPQTPDGLILYYRGLVRLVNETERKLKKLQKFEEEVVRLAGERKVDLPQKGLIS